MGGWLLITFAAGGKEHNGSKQRNCKRTESRIECWSCVWLYCTAVTAVFFLLAMATAMATAMKICTIKIQTINI